MSTAVEDTFVGVRFGEETNPTLCSTAALASEARVEAEAALVAVDDQVIVDLDTGPALGKVVRSPMPVFKPCQKAGARPIMRKADDSDRSAHAQQVKNEWTARRYCQKRSRELGLEMKVSRVDFLLSGKKATFYFTANGRVDFRQLVRDLAKRFSCRVKMVQVGARDEAGLLGGIGICGRTLCCSTWLKDFKPISIQMAKRQNLSLNPSKISGQCGRLLCCLAYEDDQYRKSKPRKARR